MPNWLWKIIDVTRLAGAANVIWTFASSPAAALYLWAPTLTAWSFVAGWREGVPTPYLLATSAATFGFINWGILQLANLIDRSRIRHRLKFTDVSLDTTWQTVPNGDITLSLVQFSADFENSSNFPIEFEIKAISSVVYGRVAREQPLISTRGIIPEKSTTFIRDSQIDLDPPIVIPANVQIHSFPGKFEIDLLYGPLGRPRFLLKKKLNTNVFFDRKNPKLFSVASTYVY